MFELPNLPFAKDSMPDFCSAETFDFHHDKHHAGYVTKLNAAIEGTDYVDKDLIEVTKTSHAEKNMAVFNNVAQHFNHSFFWESLSPEKQEIPESVAEKLTAKFGSVESFQIEFTDKATKLFGSGWAWLVTNASGNLEILQMSNADNPLTESKTPLLTIDVWEHAYYIDFRNDRGGFVGKFWDHVNWSKVEKRLL